MLQQTRVEAVIPYFERFMHELPTVWDLARVEPDRLNKLWEGLGYYSRARNLQKAAQVIVEQYGGELPANYDALCSLPGIGPYTAGAIASIAFGLPEPAVDGNVIRVCTRLCANGTVTDDPSFQKQLTEDLRAGYPREHAGTFTQALMELGATVCIPNGEPRCAQCPAAALCEAHRLGCETQYPKKPQKKPRKHCDVTVLLLTRGERVAIRRRPAKGLLASLWEFPTWEGKRTAQQISAVLGGTPCVTEGIVHTHIFTHVEWHMTSYRVSGEFRLPYPDIVWVTLPELKQNYSLPSAFRPFLEEIELHGLNGNRNQNPN